MRGRASVGVSGATAKDGLTEEDKTAAQQALLQQMQTESDEEEGEDEQAYLTNSDEEENGLGENAHPSDLYQNKQED